ncbi:LLM class F420-dependent oxidoreductase [Actinosynnema sp. NPDC020468]|uniref:LLM class F420-dependent oxidoreductase n=1 Tax=Actinosynnema sp. NPDC020468 TaxID=3154488 RepID=UPI0033E33201
MDFRAFVAPQLADTYDSLAAFALTAEAAGYGALFVSDHLVRIGPGETAPSAPGDAWTTLAGLARDTSTIRLGTLVTSATFRHPGPLAISVAQVDRMSGGRVDFGFGAGWHEEEHTAFGLPFPDVRERFDRFEEQLEIITGLWGTPVGETFSFAGKHYTLTDSPALPKPAQASVPLVIGGRGRTRTPALAARFADEFNTAFQAPEAAKELFDRFDAAARAIGRDPGTVVHSVALRVVVGRDDAEVARRAGVEEEIGRQLNVEQLRGTPGQVVDRLGEWAELGVGRVYLSFNDQNDLDHVELLASEVFPQVGSRTGATAD